MFFDGQAADEEPAPAALRLAFEERAALSDHLIKLAEDGGLDEFDDEQFVAFLQDVERDQNRFAVLQHALINNGIARGLPGTLAQTSMIRVLTQTLRISPAEASRRVLAAGQVGVRVSMTGQPLEPLRPVLAAAQRAGDVTPEQVHIIVKGLASVDGAGFDPADLSTGEVILTDAAANLGPKDLQGVADRVVEAINPDGTRPRDQLNADRRFFHLTPTTDGAYRGEFRLTGACGAKLHAILTPLATPRTDTATQEPDPRTFGQRRHDALEDVCDRLLRTSGLPDSGGTPATVIVTLSLQDLIERTGYGQTSDGTLLSAADVLTLADQADILPTVLTESGAVLDQGRSRRVATPTQTMALIARDGGCSFPAATIPRNGASGTTSPHGSTADAPTSTT